MRVIDQKNRLFSDGRFRYVESTCHFCKSTYFRRLDKPGQKFCSIKCFHSSNNPGEPLKVTSLSQQVVEGLLLSDASVLISPGSINAYFTLSSREKEFIELASRAVSFQGRISKIPPRTSKGYTSKGGWELRTKVNPFFTDLRSLWYPKGKKVIPDGIKLTATTLLFWYLGDGTLDNSLGAILCTDSFDSQSLQNGKDMLQTVGIESYIGKRNRIVIPNRYVYEFLEFIGAPPIECYGHKWNTIVKRSYFGRKCDNCNTSFDSTTNHKRFCSDSCCKKSWYKLKKHAEATQRATPR